MTSLEGALQAWPSRPMRALVQIANHVQWDGWSRVTEMLHELESLEVLTQASSTQTDTTAKLRTQLRDCAASISSVSLTPAEPLRAPAHLGWLQHDIDDLFLDCDDDNLRVAILGVFSGGKSTLINALLGHRVLPSGLEPLTAVLTEICWGPSRRVRAGDSSWAAWDRPEELADLLSRTQGVETRVRIELPTPVLKGLTIIDTPGFNSELALHTNKARQQLAGCDVGVWVFPAQKAGSELDRVELQHLVRVTGKAIGVVNKVDEIRPRWRNWKRRPKWRQQLADAVGDLQGKFADAIEDWVPVSAAWSLDPERDSQGRLAPDNLDALRVRLDEIRSEKAHRKALVARKRRREVHRWLEAATLLKHSEQQSLREASPSLSFLEEWRTTWAEELKLLSLEFVEGGLPSPGVAYVASVLGLGGSGKGGQARKRKMQIPVAFRSFLKEVEDFAGRSSKQELDTLLGIIHALDTHDFLLARADVGTAWESYLRKIARVALSARPKPRWADALPAAWEDAREEATRLFHGVLRQGDKFLLRESAARVRSRCVFQEDMPRLLQVASPTTGGATHKTGRSTVREPPAEAVPAWEECVFAPGTWIMKRKKVNKREFFVAYAPAPGAKGKAKPSKIKGLQGTSKSFRVYVSQEDECQIVQLHLLAKPEWGKSNVARVRPLLDLPGGGESACLAKSAGQENRRLPEQILAKAFAPGAKRGAKIPEWDEFTYAAGAWAMSRKGGKSNGAMVVHLQGPGGKPPPWRRKKLKGTSESLRVYVDPKKERRITGLWLKVNKDGLPTNRARVRELLDLPKGVGHVKMPGSAREGASNLLDQIMAGAVHQAGGTPKKSAPPPKSNPTQGPASRKALLAVLPKVASQCGVPVGSLQCRLPKGWLSMTPATLAEVMTDVARDVLGQAVPARPTKLTREKTENAERYLKISRIREFIKSDDFRAMERGRKLLDTLEDPEHWVVFAEGLSVDGKGRLVIPKGCEVHKRVSGIHRDHVALWALNRTGRLQKVTHLDLSWCKSLQNVDGLRGCTNLTNLNLAKCESLQNVDGLKGCTNLTNLNLAECESLLSVDGLQGCTKLMNLSLNTCKSLQDVDGLEGCTNLTTLELYDCWSLQNVDGLKGCTSLASLNLRICRSLQNVDVLKGCTNLTKLELGCSPLQNVDGLKGCTNLTNLDLTECTSLQNVDGLEGCTNLTNLDLRGCHWLQNVDGLEGCTNLTTLSLIGCYSLQNVDGLKGCINLTTLNLNQAGLYTILPTSLQNIDGLKGCTNLTTLDLRGCGGLQGIASERYEGAATIRALLSRP